MTVRPRISTGRATRAFVRRIEDPAESSQHRPERFTLRTRRQVHHAAGFSCSAGTGRAGRMPRAGANAAERADRLCFSGAGQGDRDRHLPVRALPGRLSALSVLHSKSILYGAFLQPKTVVSGSGRCTAPTLARLETTLSLPAAVIAASVSRRPVVFGVHDPDFGSMVGHVGRETCTQT